MINSFSGDYDFLSNFYYCEVEMDGIIYPSVEHAFQAAKSFLPRDRELVRVQNTPAGAKKMGRVISLRSDWENVKLQVMEDLLRKKFSNSELKAKLLATGTNKLVEGNTWGDQFWGVCRGAGKNRLGNLLMKIRIDLLEKEYEKRVI